MSDNSISKKQVIAMLLVPMFSVGSLGVFLTWRQSSEGRLVSLNSAGL
jgi:hypothetical protein